MSVNRKFSAPAGQTAARRIAWDGMFAALSLILSYIEFLLPPLLPIPGCKLGLANIVILWCVLRFGWADGVCVNLCRILLSSLLFGSVSGMLFSLCGGALSLLFLGLTYRGYPRIFSLFGLSAGSAVCHQAGQLLVTAVLYSPLSALGYSLWLLAAGIVTGCVNALILLLLTRYLPLGKEQRHATE